MDLNSYLRKECAIFDIEATTKEEAINELATLMKQSGIVKNQSKYVKSVIKREKEYTTGVGNRIAIPHGKSSTVNVASIAFGKSKNGIDWGSLDDQPVNYIFMLAIPNDSNGEHLDMLSSLARMLMRENVIKGIEVSEDYESLVEVFKDKEEETL